MLYTFLLHFKLCKYWPSNFTLYNVLAPYERVDFAECKAREMEFV